MKRLDYRYGGFEQSKLIRSSGRNLALYRLTFFSRSDRGGDFWAKARKSSFGQREFF
jgi:hypothetical protein